MGIQYRPDIDGLRAVAILPVVLFHGGLEVISGGFLGVDIFFVISGYLIASIIINDLRNNSFSILEFYERRARRILPALTVVVVFTTILAFIYLPPSILREYSQSLVAIATFTSNIFFAQEGGYFGLNSEEMIMLHTWSLAVEEQFYIIFPILMILLWGNMKEQIIKIFLTLIGLSLLTTVYFISSNLNSENFYLLPSRAWELLFGAMIPLLPAHGEKLSDRKRDIISTTGLVSVLICLFIFDKKTPHPSLLTLIPIFGTFLIIYYGTQSGFSGTILSSRPMVAIGLISYSLYLWHQPLLSILRIKTIGEPLPSQYVGTIVLAFALSIISYKLIEKPFRRKRLFQRRAIFYFACSSLALTFIVGVMGHLKDGFPNRFNSEILLTAKHSPKREECHSDITNPIEPEKSCNYYGDNLTWAAFGDSHVIEPAHALASKLKEQSNNEALIHLSFSSCPPALLFESNSPVCTRWIRDSLNFLKDSDSIKNVLIAFRHSAYLFGDQIKSYPEVPDSDPRMIMSKNFQGIDKEEARALYWASFKNVIDTLVEAKKNVFLLYPIPELPIHIEKVVTPFSIFENNPFLNIESTTSLEYYNRRNEYIIQRLESIVHHKNISAIRPAQTLCPVGSCKSVGEGKALYFDDDHLSIYGAGLIMESVQIGSAIISKKR